MSFDLIVKLAKIVALPALGASLALPLLSKRDSSLGQKTNHLNDASQLSERCYTVITSRDKDKYLLVCREEKKGDGSELSFYFYGPKATKPYKEVFSLSASTYFLNPPTNTEREITLKLSETDDSTASLISTDDWTKLNDQKLKEKCSFKNGASETKTLICAGKGETLLSRFKG